MRTQALSPNPVDHHLLMVLDQKAAIAGPPPWYVAKLSSIATSVRPGLRERVGLCNYCRAIESHALLGVPLSDHGPLGDEELLCAPFCLLGPF